MPGFELSEEIEARLEQVAKAAGRRSADLVAEAVTALLEDIEDVAAADEVLADLEAGRSRTWSLEDVERGFDLVDRVR